MAYQNLLEKTDLKKKLEFMFLVDDEYQAI